MATVAEAAAKQKPRSVKEIDSEIEELESKLRDLMEDDRTEYAQGIIDKMNTEFKKGSAWTNRMKELAEKAFYVYAPNGRKRNLPAALTEDRGIVAQQVRRGSNAPIQGFASEIGVKASRVVMESYHKELPTFCEMLDIEYDPWEWRIPYNRMVHDAHYYSPKFAMVIPFMHILQYDATYGVTEVYNKEFNIQFPVEPEIEIEFGARDDTTEKWDWSLPNIIHCVTTSVDRLEEYKLLKRKKKDVLQEVFKPWKIKKMRHYLQDKYPILGVKDLDVQIVSAIKPIYKD